MIATYPADVHGSCLPTRDRSAADAIELSANDLARAHAIARRLLGCDHLAADAVQEALVALWREPAPPADLRGWLSRAVVHRSRHLRRTLSRRRHHEHAASQHCALHAGCSNPLHIAIAHELGEQLADALASLPSPQRTALASYAVDGDGEDYAGVAASLGLPVGTVRSRLHRARATLRTAIARRGITERIAQD